eukprot:Selendium_serpulae@DN4815_c1_g1_i6.p1
MDDKIRQPEDSVASTGEEPVGSYHGAESSSIDESHSFGINNDGHNPLLEYNRPQREQLDNNIHASTSMAQRFLNTETPGFSGRLNLAFFACLTLGGVLAALLLFALGKRLMKNVPESFAEPDSYVELESSELEPKARRKLIKQPPVKSSKAPPKPRRSSLPSAGASPKATPKMSRRPSLSNEQGERVSRSGRVIKAPAYYTQTNL